MRNSNEQKFSLGYTMHAHDTFGCMIINSPNIQKEPPPTITISQGHYCSLCYWFGLYNPHEQGTYEIWRVVQIFFFSERRRVVQKIAYGCLSYSFLRDTE